MIRLEKISMEYKDKGRITAALDSLSIDLSEKGLVAVLGPSGCGKTTLLNIIGGLTAATSGAVTVDGAPLSSLDSRALDEYRRDTVGFIFQSYNLIPQETALGNTVLALTLSGLSHAESVERAKAALLSVGLTEEHLDKHPSELSGGERQRVAIARALAKEPKILLADEPTGALDEDHSEQIMKLLWECSRDRLVVLVTHNTRLAEQYATRIIKLDRGKLISDTELQKENINIETVKGKKFVTGRKSKEKGSAARSSMSFLTSLKLSLKNLWAKKFRTALVSFGSAVAILGLATVLALSAGMDAFSGALEADVTSANPITISTSTYDLDALSGYLDGTLGAMETAEALKNGEIPVSSIAAIVASDGALSVKNKLTERYFRFLSEMPKEYYGAMREKHGMDLSFGLFTDFVSRSGDEERRLSLTAVTSVYEDIISEGGAELGNLLASVAPSPMLLPTGEEYILSQYDLTGKMANNKDELVLVLGASGAVADVTLALYGYISAEETVRSFTSVASGGEPTVKSISPDELLSKDKTFTFYKNDDIFYKKNDSSGLSPFGYRYDARELGSADALTLRITGILTPKEHVTYGALPSGLYYTSELEAYARELNKNSEISKHIRATDLGSITSGYSELHGKSVGVFYELAYTHPTKNTSVTATAYMSSRVSDNLLISGLSAGLSEGESLLTLAAIGGSELPTEVQYYPRDFECKKLITDYLDRWNSDEPLKIGNLEYAPEERERVIYTDNSRAILYLINILVDRITSALLIASSLALVVSSVMISVIIYVSVGERTKEIGILRALGAGKRHVAYLFLAEGLTLGALSSVLGVLASFLICGTINSALTGAVGIITMDLATLTLTEVATVLALGVSLALLCAVIPSWLAARKAPVDAIESMA